MLIEREIDLVSDCKINFNNKEAEIQFFNPLSKVLVQAIKQNKEI